MAHIHPATPKSVIRIFTQRLGKEQWLLTTIKIRSSDFCDSIDGGCTVIYGVNTNSHEHTTPINLPEPPKSHPQPIAECIYKPFNRTEYI